MGIDDGDLMGLMIVNAHEAIIFGFPAFGAPFALAESRFSS